MNINDHLAIETEGQLSPIQQQKRLADRIYERALNMQARAATAEQSLVAAEQYMALMRTQVLQAQEHAMTLRSLAQELCSDAAFLTSELRVRP
jgi:hypothetical protein